MYTTSHRINHKNYLTRFVSVGSHQKHSRAFSGIMYRRGGKWGSPWKRQPATPDISECQRRYTDELSSKWPKFSKFKCNRWSGDNAELADLNALQSVVALVSYCDGVELIPGCGTIIESHDNAITVLTSANLIRRPTSEEFGENALANKITVCAHSYDGHSYEGGEVCAYDFHYNLSVLKFKSKTPLGPAKFGRMDELKPADRVFVMGIYFAKPFEPMTAMGEYWCERARYDCKELFMTNCKITRCGDGGPLINYRGEVIGLAFYDPDSSPCLPINIALKWWGHYKKYRKCCRPFLGFEATNLNAADLGIIARVIQKFPNAHKGVIIEKLIPDSAADLAGFHVNDVIIQCGEKRIQSLLELFEMIWEKVGVPMEFIVVRADNVAPIQLNMVFVEATLDQLYSWPANINDDSD